MYKSPTDNHTVPSMMRIVLFLMANKDHRFCTGDFKHISVPLNTVRAYMNKFEGMGLVKNVGRINGGQHGIIWQVDNVKLDNYLNDFKIGASR